MTDHANRGYRTMFGDDFSIGLFFPITTSSEAIPPMNDQVELAQYASDLGFDALWFRDVPTFWPKFDDAGQVYDPWVFLTHIAANTDDIALATGSIILPIRHPLHVAKAAASVDTLSDGRLVLGIASGDRPPEFPAFGIDENDRGERFREHVRVLRRLWAEGYPELESPYGTLDGSLDLVPKPTTETLPLLVTGHARQSPEWIAEHSDGWVYYQRDLADLEAMVSEWRETTDGDKPFVQVMHVDLKADAEAGMDPIHQGYAAGTEWFADRVQAIKDCGVDHVMINVRASDRPVRSVLEEFSEDVIETM